MSESNSSEVHSEITATKEGDGGDKVEPLSSADDKVKLTEAGEPVTTSDEVSHTKRQEDTNTEDDVKSEKKKEPEEMDVLGNGKLIKKVHFIFSHRT